jgi:large subunit ribosomal protein L5
MEASAPAAVPPRLKERYEQEIRPKLQQRFSYSSAMEVPRVEKITLNMGVGEAKQDSNMLDAAKEQLATIAGQAPSVRRARKSIAAFKLREGMPVGVSVTLRRAYMYEFLDRLMSVAIPRIRDFRGLSPRSFDGRGNYSMGVREQIIFPEIDYDAIDQVRGLDVTITTSAKSDEEAYALLLELGMPFQREGAPGAGGEDREAAEEEQRKEEARARAEAEQAALEELKEENPEAYEKPTPARAEEGEEAGEGPGPQAAETNEEPQE